MASQCLFGAFPFSRASKCRRLKQGGMPIIGVGAHIGYKNDAKTHAVFTVNSKSGTSVIFVTDVSPLCCFETFRCQKSDLISPR